MYSVLYVDDEPTLLDLGKIFLEESKQFSVDTSTSASDALARISPQKYDAIISDYQMPAMDGIEFLKAVRASGNEIPFILFTGRGREEVVIEAINNGADFYLQKGGDPTAQFAELAHKLRQAVSRRKAQEELRAAYEQIAAAEEELRGQYDELARNERLLRENRELFQTFMDSAMDGFTIWDADLNLIEINRAALALNPSVLRKEDLLGMNIREFLEGDDAWGKPERFREIIRTGVPVSETSKSTRMGSGMRWVDLTCFRVGTGIGIVIHDVTRQKEAEDALRRSEERYRSVVNDQTMMIARFTPDGTITFVNNAYHDYYAPRLGLDNVTGKTIREIMQVQNYAAVEMFLASLTEDQPVRDMEREIIGTDGNPYWQIWTVKAIFDKDHRISEYQVIGRDITDRKRAEDALKQSEERFRAMVEQSPFSIIVFTPDGSAVHANDAHCRFWGITKDRVLSYNVFRDPQMERLGLLPAFRRAFAGEQLTVPPMEYDLQATLGSGQKKMVRGDFYPIRDEHGAVTHVILVHQDVLDRPS